MSEFPKAKLCKCGKPADFIKDYWVSETKSKKQTEYDNMYGGERVEKACGIIRRRYCSSCLSKIARIKYKRERKYNTVIIASAVMPFLIAAGKYAYDFISAGETSALIPMILAGLFSIVILFSLLFKLGAGQKQRKLIAYGKFSNLSAVDALIDSLTTISDWRTIRDLPSSEIVVDADGRVNSNLERSGYFMRVVYEDRIGIESMRHRLKFDFDENSEYLKRSYLNAGFLEDNIDTEPVKKKKLKNTDKPKEENPAEEKLAEEKSTEENFEK